MTSRNVLPSEDQSRVVPFRKPARKGGAGQPPLQDMERYERDAGEPDDYRHRMIVNVLAFVFVAALVGVGLWLADSIADLRRTQDCLLTGRSGCAPIAIEKPGR